MLLDFLGGGSNLNVVRSMYQQQIKRVLGGILEPPLRPNYSNITIQDGPLKLFTKGR